MDLDEIRRLVIISMFSDDVLLEQLVLKGGNALSLVHGLSTRGSVDIDFSLRTDFDDGEDVKRRIFRALRDRFDSAGYVVFDEKMYAKPAVVSPDRADWWGGYAVEFKLISKAKHAELGGDVASIRKQAEVVGPQQKRTFKIDISKYEYCETKVEKEFDDYTIYVYTLEMIVIEKIRAICQQMPEYEVTRDRARARDFYDICKILDANDIDLRSPDNQALFRAVFSAKKVPLSLMAGIGKQRELHRQDWPAVRDSVSDKDLRDFDHYFERVVDLTRGLEPLWKE